MFGDTAPKFLQDVNLVSLAFSGINSFTTFADRGACFIWVLIGLINLINIIVFKYKYSPIKLNKKRAT